MPWADIHWVALFTSTLIYLVVGAFWYSPFLFGEIWRDTMAFRPEKLTPPGKAWLGAALNALIASIGLLALILFAGAETGLAGMKIAFFAWLGVSATDHFNAVLWGNRPLKIFFIDAGNRLVSLLPMGFILGGF